MTGEQYDTEWVPFHRQLFGMKSEDDLPMFAYWFRSLCEFSTAELRSASMAMATDIETAGKFRTEHLSILRSKVRQQRFERCRAEFAELNRAQARLDCAVCGGTGLVSVPHVGSIADGEWTHPFCTMVAACRCPRGAVRLKAVSAAEAKQDVLRQYRVKMIDIDEYEMHHPDWRRMVHDRDLMRDSELHAQRYAKEADMKNPINAIHVGGAIQRAIASHVGVSNPRDVGDEPAE
jgi:hypothetical protein